MHWATVAGLLTAVVVVVSWLGVEWYRWWRGRSLVAALQLALRTTIAALICAIVAMIVWGSYHDWRDPMRALLYWVACLGLLLIVMVLTLRDWRMILREQHLRRAQLYRRMDEELGTLRERNPREDD